MPWGNYIPHSLSDTYQVKEIYLANKDDGFSYHFHKLVDEIWYIKKGKVRVFIEEFQEDVDEGAVFLIPKRSRHSLINIGISEVIIIETQIGIIDNNDVYRLKDKYGRSELLCKICYFLYLLRN